MKYSEYLQLSEILEADGTTVKGYFKVNEGQPATVTPPATNEKPATKAPAAPAPTAPAQDAPEAIEQKKGNIFTTSGRLKMKLNGVAKKTQTQLATEVLKKYLPKILANEKAQIDKVIAGAKNIKNPEQKKALIDQQMAAISKATDQQYATIDAAISKFIQTSTATMTQKIATSTATEKQKMLLTNYWTLLTTQMQMNASMYIIAQRGKLLDALYGNDVAAAKAAKEKQANTKERANLKAQVASLTTKNGQLEKEVDAVKSAAVPKITVGGKYIYTDAKGQPQNVTITQANVQPGQAQITYDNNPKQASFAVPITKLKAVPTTPTDASTAAPAVEKPATPPVTK